MKESTLAGEESEIHVVTKQLLLETMDIEKKIEFGVPLSKADHYKIKKRVKESTATGAEIKLNRVLIALFQVTKHLFEMS